MKPRMSSAAFAASTNCWPMINMVFTSGLPGHPFSYPPAGPAGHLSTFTCTNRHLLPVLAPQMHRLLGPWSHPGSWHTHPYTAVEMASEFLIWVTACICSPVLHWFCGGGPLMGWWLLGQAWYQLGQGAICPLPAPIPFPPLPACASLWVCRWAVYHIIWHIWTLTFHLQVESSNSSLLFNLKSKKEMHR